MGTTDLIKLNVLETISNSKYERLGAAELLKQNPFLWLYFWNVAICISQLLLIVEVWLFIWVRVNLLFQSVMYFSFNIYWSPPPFFKE